LARTAVGACGEVREWTRKEPQQICDCQERSWHRASRRRRSDVRPERFCRPKRSKIKLGKAILNLRPKFLKIKYALVVHLSPDAHLPLRTVALIFF
jgi:hypothetical protein